MKTLHAKSPCCLTKVNRFGKRRRQCRSCGKTWRIRVKKRGRKSKRAREYLALRFFQKRLPPLRTVAKARGLWQRRDPAPFSQKPGAVREKHQDDWLKLLQEPGPLIAVADAIWYYVNGEKYAIYVVLLRPVNSSEAMVCPPVILPGHENIKGWRDTFQNLRRTLEKRIVALVSDGGTGIMLAAKTKPWIIQRCHFHLISAVQNYLTTSPRSPHRELAFEVLRMVQKILNTNKPSELEPLINKVQMICHQISSRGLRRVLGGLIDDLPDFHAYLNHPQLHLSATSNTAESFIQCIRDLMYRCKGFRSLPSLQKWVQAVAIFKKTMRCNEKLSTKSNR